MKVSESVLLRDKESPEVISMDAIIGKEYLCPSLFGGYISCRITKIGDMGDIWAESEGSCFLIQAVENGLQNCLQIDKRCIEMAEF